MDYADQRYYSSGYGRFNTVDPLQSSAKPKNPASWNRYAYVGGDPVNLLDPRGMEQSGCGPDWVSDPSLSGPCCLPGGNGFLPDPAVNAACYTGSGDDEDNDDSSDSGSSQPPQCPPGYVPATTQAQLNGIVATAESYNNNGITHAPNSHYVWSSSGVLSAIDCTGLIAQALAGIAFSATNLQQASLSMTTSSIPNLFSLASTVQVGDIVDFGTHAGIVTGVNSSRQITSFEGSQNRTGPDVYNITAANSKWLNLSNAKVYTPCVPGN
jgi:hypothetical protein